MKQEPKNNPDTTDKEKKELVLTGAGIWIYIVQRV